MITIQNLFKRQASQPGLGTVSGVLIPNILQMIGVILFMRLGWITGHIGLPVMITIITFSSTILLVTGLSMTSIITNMRIEGGGSYYIISRSLGIELGTALGILLAVSQMTSIALCVSGFSLTLMPWLPDVPVVVIELMTVTVLTILSYVSTNLVVKTQLIIFLVIAFSVYTVFSGSPSNIPADFAPIPTLETLTFWAAFSMFFPATTGIEAGMSVSGELRNPNRSLPIGTIGSIIIAYLLYSSLAFFLSTNVSKELLISYPMIATNLAKVGFFVILGIWGATLSSALGGIIGAPRTIQAIAKDGMIPKFLAKGVGKSELPRSAILIVFLSSTVLTAFTNINQLIPFQAMICLMTYALVNFVAFFETAIQNPSWRPSFKTPWIVSLGGTLVCIISMFMFNPGASFIVLILLCLLTGWAGKRQIKGNWDDIRYSLFSLLASFSAKQLIRLKKNPKSWRPHLLTFMSPSLEEEHLAYFAHSLNQSRGFLTFGITPATPEEVEPLKEQMKKFLTAHDITGFYQVNQDPHTLGGMKSMVETYGLGPLRPNTILLPADFLDQDPELFAQLLISSFHHEKNVLLLNPSYSDLTLFKQVTKEEKRIHLWWGGQYHGNFQLSLALSHQLQHSKIWENAALHIHTLVPNEATCGNARKKFEEYGSKLRLRNLHFTPIIKDQSDFFSTLRECPHNDGLSFLGLRPPHSEESPQDYAVYLKDLIQQTKQVHNLIFALAGENMDFKKLFQ